MGVGIQEAGDAKGLLLVLWVKGKSYHRPHTTVVLAGEDGYTM